MAPTLCRGRCSPGFRRGPRWPALLGPAAGDPRCARVRPLRGGSPVPREREPPYFIPFPPGLNAVGTLGAFNGIFWILHTGAQWRELPERYGKWKSVYDRYNRWRGDGTIDRMLERLHLRLHEHGRIDVEFWCIDAMQIRASRAAAGAAGEIRARRA